MCLIVRETNGEGDLPYFIQTVVGNGDNKNLNVDVPGLSASVGVPVSLARSNGDLYFVSPSKHVVLKAQFNPSDGSFDNVVVFVGTGLSYPSGVSLIEDSNGDATALLIADTDNNRIRKVDMTSTPVTITRA